MSAGGYPNTDKAYGIREAWGLGSNSFWELPSRKCQQSTIFSRSFLGSEFCLSFHSYRTGSVLFCWAVKAPGICPFLPCTAGHMLPSLLGLEVCVPASEPDRPPPASPYPLAYSGPVPSLGTHAHEQPSSVLPQHWLRTLSTLAVTHEYRHLYQAPSLPFFASPSSHHHMAVPNEDSG